MCSMTRPMQNGRHFSSLIIIRKTFDYYNPFLIKKREREILQHERYLPQHHGRPRSNHLPQGEALPTARLQLPSVAQVRAATTSWLPSLPEASGSESSSTSGASKTSYRRRGLTSTCSQACRARGFAATSASYQ